MQPTMCRFKLEKRMCYTYGNQSVCDVMVSRIRGTLILAFQVPVFLTVLPIAGSGES